jgi:SPP1 family predicted phage head-tail adaptor
MVPSWVAAFPMPISAEITALSGRELIAAQAEQSAVTTRIKVRYRPGFVTSMRILHRNTVYNVEAAIPDPDSGFEWVTLLCSSGLNEG